MEGIFLRKKFNIGLFILFICGLFFIGLYIFLNIVDPTATSELLTFLLFGILIVLIVIPSWLLNFGAFLRIEEDLIKAKYHWFGKIDCKLSDVTFATAQINTLIIQLKDGKIHTITGIENPFPLACVIKRNMTFDSTEQPEDILKNIDYLKSSRKKNLTYLCLCIALMFINIFITVFLTDEKEMYEFGKTDWIIFAIMSAIEIITVIATFYFALKAGKNNIPLQKLQYTLQRRIIETTPLLPGNIIKIVTDDNYSGRITLFKHQTENSVYYAVQEFAPDYTLIKVFESEIFDSDEDLPMNLDVFIDITKKALH